MCFLATIPRMPAIRDVSRRLHVAESSMTALVTVWNRSVAGRQITREVRTRETRRWIASPVSTVATLPASAERLIMDIHWESLALGELARERMATEHLAA
jgi:hypothetical protein